MLNPAAVYCTGLNYTYTVTTAPDGGQIGMCILPDRTSVDAWQFLEGRVAQQYSYCGLHDYPVHTVQDPNLCAGIFSDRCAFCVLEKGKEMEVTRLMNLTFREPDLVLEPPACNGDTCAVRPPVAEVTTVQSSPCLFVVGMALCAIAYRWRRRT
jgi:Domain of unknown function (DUF333).